MKEWHFWYSDSDLRGMARTLGYEIRSDHGWDVYAIDPADSGRRIPAPVLVREWEARLRAVHRCDVARFRVGKKLARPVRPRTGQGRGSPVDGASPSRDRRARESP